MDSPESRRTVTPGALYRHLAERFAERRPPGCRACRMPLPFATRPPGDTAANWRIGTPPGCAAGCAEVMAAIVEEAQRSFDLAFEGAARPAPP